MERRLCLVTSLLCFTLAGFCQFSPAEVVWEVQAKEARRMIVVDLDQDGVLDLLCGSRSSWGVFWFKLSSSGTVSSYHRIARIEVFVGCTIDTSDVDLDGDLDIVATGRPGDAYFGQGMYLIRNMGAGIFSSPETILSESPLFRFADMDSDGDGDLVCWGVNDQLLLNDGTGVFSPSSNPIYFSEDALLLDMDGDGDTDAFDTYLGDWHEQTPGGFVDHVSPNLLVGDEFLATDIDLDGDMDLIGLNVNDGIIMWHANDGTGNLSPSQILFEFAQLVDDMKVCMTDFDTDGDPDMLATVDDMLGAYSVYLIENQGAMLFASGPQLASLPSDEVSAQTVGDLNTDGQPDVVLGCYMDVFMYANMGGNQIAQKQYFNRVADSPRDVRWCDVDADGRTDAVTCGYKGSSPDTGMVAWFRKLPDGNYELPVIISTSNADYSSVAVGDLDADGDMDIMATGSNPGMVIWYENDGVGQNWTEHSVSNAAVHATTNCTDIDQDGDLDHLVFNNVGVYWFKNDGIGNFSLANVGPASGVDGTEFLDAEGDGDLDVVISADELHIFLNDGAGVFIVGSTIPTSTSTNYNIAVLDLEPDGDQDIIGAGPWGTNELRIYMNDGSGSFSIGQVLESAPAMTYAPFAALDLDGDGDEDFIYNVNALPECIYNEGGGVLAVAPCPEILWADPSDLRTRDVDMDGDLDLVRMNSILSRITSYENHQLNPLEAGGTVFLDMDQDGLLDPGEPGLAVMVPCLPNTGWSYAVDGAFRFALDSGSYVIGPTSLASPWWLLSSDSSEYHLDMTLSDTLVGSLDFGYIQGSPVTDASVALSSDPTRCGWTIAQYLDVLNLGNTILQGQLVLELDPLISFNGSIPPPTSIVGQTITWSIDSVFYFTSGQVEFTCELPGVQFLGDTLMSSFLFTATDDLGNTLGTFPGEWSSVLNCAYDPNDKGVTPSGYGSLGAVDVGTEVLEYLVRFQNTGTDTAFTVTIRDPLPAEVDATSLLIMGTSHTLTDVRLEADEELVLVFNDIMLPDSNVNEVASHGYVRFRFALVPGLSSSTVIRNDAQIYFDFNPPIITNETITTLIDCSLFSASITQTSPSTLEASSGATYQWYLFGSPLPGEVGQVLVTYYTGEYTVVITSEFGCVQTSQVFNYESNSVDEDLPLHCKAVPNPFSDRVTLWFDQPITGEHVLDMIDVHGRIVRQLMGDGSTRMQLNVEDVEKGLYMLRVSLGKEVVGLLRLAVGE